MTTSDPQKPGYLSLAEQKWHTHGKVPAGVSMHQHQQALGS